jgi:hypothetical protein
VFLGALLAAHLVPGALGILAPGTVTATAVIGAVLVSRLPVTAASTERRPTPGPVRDSGRLSVVLAAVAAFLVTVCALAVLLHLRNQPPTHVDAVSFALPGVASWLRSGSIWHVGAFLPLIQARTYPNNGDLLALATILPWRNDAFLRLTFLPLLGMTGVGVYAIGRELRAPRASAVLLAAAVVATGAVAVSALESLKPDVFMYATFAAGCAFLIRHARTDAGSDLLLAGLGMGLAFGSRWYGITSVFVVAGVWIAAQLLSRRLLRRVLRAGAVLGAAVLAAGGFWFIRNTALTGNPLYPVRVAPFGVTLLSAPPDILVERFGFTIADRFNQPDVLRHDVLPGFWDALGLAGLLVLGGVLIAVALAAGRAGRDPRALAVAAAALALAIAYVFLPAGSQGPESRPVSGIVAANTRWLVPAVILGGGATAWAAGRLRRAGIVIEIAAFVGVLVSLHHVFDASAKAFALAAVVVGAVALTWFARSAITRALRELSPSRRRAVTIAGASIAVLAIAGAGELQQRRYNDGRYDPISPLVAWVDVHAPSGHRVGIAGFWASGLRPHYGLFGPRLGNDVAYVGPIESDQVRTYHDPATFRRALRGGHYDVLAVGRLAAPSLANPRPPRMLANPPQARWARPAGFVRVASDASGILLARTG